MQAVVACIEEPAGVGAHDLGYRSEFDAEPETELVFAQETVETEEGDAISSFIEGALSDEQLQMVARPWRPAVSPDGYLYQESAYYHWSPEDGTITRGYFVTRVPGEVEPVVSDGLGDPEAKIDPRVDVAIEDAGAFGSIEVLLKVAYFPDYDLPVLPALSLVSEATFESVVEQRAARAEERQALLDDAVTGIAAAIEAGGGQVTDRFWQTGWVAATVPAFLVGELSERHDIAEIELNYEVIDADQSGTLGGQLANDRLGADAFLVDNMNGTIANPTRHTVGDLVAGIAETSYFEDEACAFRGGSNCNGSRIVGRYLCPYTGACNYVANVPDCEDSDCCDIVCDFNGAHGTIVASHLLGSYAAGQGTNRQLGDPDWTSGAHSSQWSADSSASARGAALAFISVNAPEHTPNVARYSRAYERATSLQVDVLNASHNLSGLTSGGGSCSIDSSSAAEDAMEAAFDDGVFNVAAAGNVNGGTALTCNLGTPADTPKVFAVNGLNASLAACQADYDDCYLDSENSARGMAAAIVSGSSYNAVTGIDLAAPQRLTHSTMHVGLEGEVAEDQTFGGTSFAAPIVAGSALLLKHWHLSLGNTWINEPGRLHAFMLAMGDRRGDAAPPNNPPGSSGLFERMTAGDRYLGFGRLRLRRLDASGGLGPVGWSFRHNASSTAGSTFEYYPLYPNTQFPTGVQFVKCVAHTVEDMSGKNHISDVDLTVRITPGGNCGAGNSIFSRTDSSRDVKSLVAIHASEVTGGLAGRCMAAKLTYKVIATGGANVDVVCYYAGVDDAQEPSL